jgi:outer membrane protein OmpA-like peptidoglycan-associated protein
VRLPLGEQLVVGAAVGTGIGVGIGAPKVRVLASVGWLPKEKLTSEAPVEEPVAVIRPDPPVAGTLSVQVSDVDGQPLVATVALMGTDRVFTTTAMGTVSGKLAAGSHELFIRADGYRPERRSIVVEADKTIELAIRLVPLRARVESGEIKINDKIFFEFDSSAIKPESRVILDDVAQVMLEHPEILLLEVEGHTDDVGEAAYNQQLSEARADAVMRYLMEHGVEPERLIARGYGESRPLIAEATEEARDVNRRVVFRIAKEAKGTEDSRRKQKE